MLSCDFWLRQKAYTYFVIAVAIFIIDQATKTWVKKSIHPFENIHVAPFFNLVYVENTGSAFGMFKSLGNTFFVSISIFAIIVISILIIKDKTNRLPYALLLGGALGNMTDRLIYGYVIDFLDFHIGGYHWYAFNIADASLSVGMLLMLINVLLPQKTAKNEAKTT
ncbi:MAG: signal peptidase II [Thermodesulfovibrionales bacterium]